MNLGRDIGAVLQVQRIAQGLSKAEVSRRLGYCVSSISNMEKGSGHVLWSRYCRYMAELGITWKFVPRDC